MIKSANLSNKFLRESVEMGDDTYTVNV